MFAHPEYSYYCTILIKVILIFFPLHLQSEKRLVTMTRKDLSHNVLEVEHTDGTERWLVVKTTLQPRKVLHMLYFLQLTHTRFNVSLHYSDVILNFRSWYWEKNSKSTRDALILILVSGRIPSDDGLDIFLSIIVTGRVKKVWSQSCFICQILNPIRGEHACLPQVNTYSVVFCLQINLK